MKAKDQNPGKNVAIGFLPEKSRRDTECVARLQRKAKLRASLIPKPTTK